MIAIHTKYLSPTNNNGARIKAYTASYGSHKGFSASIGYNYALDSYHVHFEAVKALIEKHNLNWDLAGMRSGDSADGRGFSFCFESSKV